MRKWNARYHDVYKYHSLIDKVWAMDNLNIAWKRVKANKGASGIDNMTVYGFEKDLEKHLATIQRQLKEGRYIPKPVKRVYIEKDKDSKRPLGIPTVKDRVVQQALRQVLEPIFEENFLPQSYGYRPNRSALDAVEKVRGLIQDSKYQAVADLDIKGFFDNVNHDVLLDLVNEKVSDGRILKLIRSFLEAGVMIEGGYIETVLGTPQGGVISPLLANIYLHHIDRRLNAYGLEFVRYADDIVILSEKMKDTRKCLNLAKIIIEQDLKLELNKDKTKFIRVVKSKGLEFLGQQIFIDRVKPMHKALTRFKNKVRFLTRRQQGKKVETVIRRLNPLIRGWGNYFKNCTVKVIFWDLDFWIRRRIRGYIKKRWRWSDVKRIPAKEILSMGLLTLETVMDKPRPLLWRVLRGHNDWM